MRSGATWTQQARIVKGGTASAFGMQCAISGDSVIVGSRNEVGGGAGGAAYIFVRSGGVWTQQARLTGIAPNSGIIGDFVTIDGDTAALSVSGDSFGGSLQIYVHSGGVWKPQQRIIASDGGGQFGRSAAINGYTLVGSTPGNSSSGSSNTGAAYVFVRNGGVWTQQQKLILSNTGSNANFGWSVAINGNTVIISAWAGNNRRNRRGFGVCLSA